LKGQPDLAKNSPDSRSKPDYPGGSKIGHHQGSEARRRKARKERQACFQEVGSAESDLKFFGGTTPGTKLVYGKKRRMSPAGRRAISRATKARWAKLRELKETAAKAPKQTMSATTRARMGKAQQQRWAKVRAAKVKKAA
jgi:hypothetical protein